MSRCETVSFGVALAVLSAPAFAVPTMGAPAPVVGIGLGAIALVGVGYRALKNQIRP
jgi:hypothetical protein